MSQGRLLYQRVWLNRQGLLAGVWAIEALPRLRMRLSHRHGGCLVCERPVAMTTGDLKRLIDSVNRQALVWCGTHGGDAPVAEPVRNLQRSIEGAQEVMAHSHRMGATVTLL